MTKTEALSLLDIDLRHEMVQINEKQSLRVRGISIEDIKVLFTRFPALMGLAVGRGLDTKAVMDLGPEIVMALCAAGVGELGNKQAEDMAGQLSVETQLDILEAMGRCTFSKGFGPFAQRLAGVAKALSVEVGKAPDTNLPKPSKLSAVPPTPPSGK